MFDNKAKKDNFILHTCCAPCGIAVIDELRKNFDLTVFFYNPNIYPENEYLKRKAEVIGVCEEWKVPMIDGDYEPQKWNEATKGLEQEPEGGARCPVCFSLRLGRTAELAAKMGFGIFGTTLTMGRTKNASVINPIGKIQAEKFGVEFYDENWKTKGRDERGRQMAKERGIYRQNFCGCKYSVR